MLRQLTIGPSRFSDLRRELGGISPSVLTERLGTLEAAGLIKRTEIEKPVPGTVYELDEAGVALRPSLDALASWGTRYLFPPRPEDRLDPEWFRWFLASNRKIAGPPEARIELRMRYHGKDRRIFISAGDHPTEVSENSRDDEIVDVIVSGDSMAVAAVAAGMMAPGESVAAGLVSIEGEAGVLARFHDCFELGLPLPSSSNNPLDSGGD